MVWFSLSELYFKKLPFSPFFSILCRNSHFCLLVAVRRLNQQDAVWFVQLCEAVQEPELQQPEEREPGERHALY